MGRTALKVCGWNLSDQGLDFPLRNWEILSLTVSTSRFLASLETLLCPRSGQLNLPTHTTGDGRNRTLSEFHARFASRFLFRRR